MLQDRAFNIAKNPKYDRYQRVFASVVYEALIKSLQVKNEITPNQELADDLNKPIIRKFEKGK